MTTQVKENNVIELEAINDSWAWNRLGSEESLKVVSIKFKAGANNDILTVKEKSLNGPVLFYKKIATALDSWIEYYDGSSLQPVIDFNKSTLSAGHSVVIILKD